MMLVPGLESGGQRGGRNPRSLTGGGGNRELPKNAADAMNTLDQFAPIMGEDEEQQYPPGTVESFLQVAFVAVLGEKPAEDAEEGGDQ